MIKIHVKKLFFLTLGIACTSCVGAEMKIEAEGYICVQFSQTNDFQINLQDVKNHSAISM